MEDKSLKDYEDNIKILSLANNSLEHDKKKIILMVKSKPNKTAVFKIYEKERIWLKTLDYKDFSKYKETLGFESSWLSFFKTMSLAILRENGGDMQLKYPKTIKVDLTFTQDPFVLYFYHPISEELKVKGEITFDTSFGYSSEEFINNVYELVFDFHESEQNYKSCLKFGTNHNSHITTNDGNLDSKKKTKIGEIKKATKRKFVADLVNPNAKRRKGKGAKFTNEGNEENSKEEESSQK